MVIFYELWNFFRPALDLFPWHVLLYLPNYHFQVTYLWRIHFTKIVNHFYHVQRLKRLRRVRILHRNYSVVADDVRSNQKTIQKGWFIRDAKSKFEKSYMISLGLNSLAWKDRICRKRLFCGGPFWRYRYCRQP